MARTLLQPGDVVAVEEPGYPPVRELLRAHRAEVAGVPVDGHGIVVDAIPPALTAVRQIVDWCPPATTQHALTLFLEDGHLQRIRPEYTRRHTRLSRELRQRLPGYHLVPAHAGLHLAVLGPETPAEDDLRRRTAARGVLVSSLRRTYLEHPADGFLVGFGALPAGRNAPAVKALAAAL